MVMLDLGAGPSLRAAAARREVAPAPATASRWAREAAAGVLGPRPEGGRGRRKLGAHRDWLRAEVAARPRVTLAALQAGLRARGCAASLNTIWRFLREEGLGVGERGVGRASGDA